jgi:phosphate transport system permease protein
MTAPATPHRRADTSPPVRRPGDLFFSGASLGSAVLILLILAGVALFLVLEAIPALTAAPEDVTGGEGFASYVWPLVFGTVVSSLIAMVLATPVAIGIALFVSHYAPRSLGNSIGFVIDLLAAVPSVVFGMWGMAVFAPQLGPLYSWLEDNLGWIPLFADASATGRTLLTASSCRRRACTRRPRWPSGPPSGR